MVAMTKLLPLLSMLQQKKEKKLAVTKKVTVEQDQNQNSR
jgi:hypothetical protein